MAFDIKAATADTTLASTGFLMGADSQSAADPSIYSALAVAGCLLGATCMSGETITTDKNLINHAVTWNAGGVTFTGWKLNVTNTASAAGSLLMDLQVGGTSVANIPKQGHFVSANASYNDPLGNGRWIVKHSAGNYGLSYSDGGSGGTTLFNGTATASLVGSVFSSVTFGLASSPTGGAADVLLERDAANTLAQRNSTNAQTFRIYNTYTDASNYERAGLYWSSNVFCISGQKAGTGSTRLVRILTNDDANSYIEFDNASFVSVMRAPFAMHLQTENSSFVFFGGSSSPRATFAGRDVIGWGRSSVSPNIYQEDNVDDAATAQTLTIRAQNAGASNASFLDGGDLVLKGGDGASGSAGDADGGSVYIRGGTKYGTGTTGFVIMDNLPTSASGLPTGALWNNSGVVTIV